MLTIVQQELFPIELKAFEKKTDLPVKSKLSKLSPFIDEYGLLRTKGRLQHSNLPYEQKHLIILIANHPIVQLKLIYEHESNNHEGTEYVRSLIQQQFWIIGLRNALRQIKRNCVLC